MALKAPPLKAALASVQSIGLGFDISNDVRLKFCKRGSHLIELSEGDCQNVVLPGGLVIPDVPRSIKVDKGERIRFASDVLSFEQMATQFNQEMSIFGKIPSGLFNHMFEFFGSWQNEAAKTKSLAFNGWFITLYTVALSKPQVVLCDHVKEAVPSTWDPAALARFIQKYGTHVITAIKIGGKDVIYMKQQYSSTLQSSEFLKILKEIAEKRFFVASHHHEESYLKDKFREQRLRFAESSSSSFYSNKEDIKGMFKRRGGSEDNSLSHSEWLKTVRYQPDVISMSFIPITSLLNGVPGSGFLNHAINIYLRYKPPIEELHQFLEFQLPRQWAPAFGDLPLGPCQKQHGGASLQFTFMGPKLHVNTSTVDVGKKPVTGLRLHLEGKKGNRLAIHLQHLISLPQILKLQDVNNGFHQEAYDRKYYEPVQWKHFSHVCTAPVEADDDLSIVTSARLHVGSHGFKKVLLLWLGYATVQNAVRVRTDWDGSPGLAQKSGLFSTLISTHFSMAIQKPLPRPADMNVNSAVYPGGPPVPVQTPRLLKLVDTTEMTRGPQDSPGYWVVAGAKLHLERGKISLRVKYSLLTVLSADDEDD